MWSESAVVDARTSSGLFFNYGPWGPTVGCRNCQLWTLRSNNGQQERNLRTLRSKMSCSKHWQSVLRSPNWLFKTLKTFKHISKRSKTFQNVRNIQHVQNRWTIVWIARILMIFRSNWSGWRDFFQKFEQRNERRKETSENFSKLFRILFRTFFFCVN